MPSQGRLGDQSFCSSDSHGCTSCSHAVKGPATSGSPNVLVNGKPALRVSDTGIHSACCGANTWSATAGSSSVFINGLPAHRLGDAVNHCGGVGKLIEGSQNVFVGDQGTPAEDLHTQPDICYQCLLNAATAGTPFATLSA